MHAYYTDRVAQHVGESNALYPVDRELGRCPLFGLELVGGALPAVW